MYFNTLLYSVQRTCSVGFDGPETRLAQQEVTIIIDESIQTSNSGWLWPPSHVQSRDDETMLHFQRARSFESRIPTGRLTQHGLLLWQKYGVASTKFNNTKLNTNECLIEVFSPLYSSAGRKLHLD